MSRIESESDLQSLIRFGLISADRMGLVDVAIHLNQALLAMDGKARSTDKNDAPQDIDEK